MGFKMYKGDAVCDVDDRQEVNMKKAGWGRTPPDKKIVEEKAKKEVTKTKAPRITGVGVK